MLDQVQAFTAKGMKCAYVGAQKSDSVNLHVEKGEFSLVFMSPESQVSGCRWRKMFRSAIYQANLVGVVVDEAHCIDKRWVKFVELLYTQIDYSCVRRGV